MLSIDIKTTTDGLPVRVGTHGELRLIDYRSYPGSTNYYFKCCISHFTYKLLSVAESSISLILESILGSG